MIVAHIIRTWTFCFAVTCCPSATSMCLSVSSNETGIKYEIYGIMSHVFSRIQNPIDQLWTVTKISTRIFVITIHAWHICIYLLVAFIFAVVACTIAFSIKTYLFSPFLVIFWWLWTFAIRWSSDPHLKHFRDFRSVRMLSEAPSARAFSFSCLIILKKGPLGIFCMQILMYAAED